MDVFEVSREVKEATEVYTLDGSVDRHGNQAVRHKTGKWFAGIIILVNQGLATLAFFGVGVNLVLFLTRVVGQNNADAANSVSKWTGTVYIFSLVGAFLSDSYWGRYKTCAVFQVIFVVGLALLSVSTHLFLLKPKGCGDLKTPCAPHTNMEMGLFYLSIYLIALGNGGYQPNIATFGADQFDEEHPREAHSKVSFFSYFYLALNLGELFSNTILVFFEDEGFWVLGFWASTASAFAALVLFLLGTPRYRHFKASGNPLSRFCQVLVSACRKWRTELPSEGKTLYEANDKENSANTGRKMLHTDGFKALDKAALVTSGDLSDQGQKIRNPWRLCPVTQVEEVKCILRLLPIWLCTIIYSVVFTQMASLFVEQGAAMKTTVSGFQIPPASMSSFDILSVAAFIFIYRRVLDPIVSRIRKKNARGITELQRMGVGLIIAIVAMIAAGIVELYRLKYAPKDCLHCKAIMPPRVPARAIASLPLSNGAVASSSALPARPSTGPSSPKSQSRGFHTVPRVSHRPALNVSVNTAEKRSFHSTNFREARQKDPYDVLGVKKDSTASDIKKAYYQLAKKWHPDSNKEKGAQERFVEIQSAYDILSDDKKRQAYDQYGSASTEEGFDPNFARGAGGFGGFQGFGGFGGGQAGSAGDLFESLFGSAFGGGGGSFGSQRSRPMRGDDIEATVNLTFLEACQGALRKLTISPVVNCKPCSGSGLKPCQKKSSCATCRGTGQQTFQVSGMIMASPCQSCGGTGSTIPRSARCGECDGLGRLKESQNVEVDIPAGVEDGMKVKLPGKGDMPLGASGPPGDLFVRVNVKASPVFRRQGTNIYHEAKVPLHTAMLGGKVRIPTLEGEVDVRVREGTQNGEEAVLKGRGVKSLMGLSRDRGDLVVAWKIQIPRSLSPFQKKIMRAFADDIEGKDPNVYFGSPPESTSTSTNGTDTSASVDANRPSKGDTKDTTRKGKSKSGSGKSGVEEVRQDDAEGTSGNVGEKVDKEQVNQTDSAKEEASKEETETENEEMSAKEDPNTDKKDQGEDGEVEKKRATG